jgi:hypothetical protein
MPPITTLKRNCFDDCPRLRKVILQESFTSIEENALAGFSISDVTIPSSVAHIGINALFGISDVTFKPADEMRFFIGDVFGDLDYIRLKNMTGGWFVVELPVRNCMSPHEVDEYAAQNNLTHDDVENLLALVPVRVQDALIYPYDERITLPKELFMYVCVPGKGDVDMCRQFRAQKPFIRPAGSAPVQKVMRDQYIKAGVTIDYTQS